MARLVDETWLILVGVSEAGIAVIARRVRNKPGCLGTLPGVKKRHLVVGL